MSNKTPTGKQDATPVNSASAPLISLVVPVYNEEDAVSDGLTAILAAARQSMAGQVELIVVDDGSVDATAAVIRRLAESDSSIRPHFFTRNFGKEAAILAGLDKARGDAVIILDVDLQHPPALIPQMVSLWLKGHPVVEAIKRRRHDRATLGGLMVQAYYSVFRRFTGLDLAIHSDYKLLDRKVVDTLRQLPERRRFFRGLVAWMGYPTVTVAFDVPARMAGESRFSGLRLWRYALDNLTAFSAVPLSIIGVLGLLVLASGGVLGLVALYQKFTGVALDGFTTVIVLLSLVGGAIMISLGIIGIYLARIYEEIKQRPVYLLRPNESDKQDDTVRL